MPRAFLFIFHLSRHFHMVFMPGSACQAMPECRAFSRHAGVPPPRIYASGDGLTYERRCTVGGGGRQDGSKSGPAQIVPGCILENKKVLASGSEAQVWHLNVHSDGRTDGRAGGRV
eukprot:gene19341-biopygen954